MILPPFCPARQQERTNFQLALRIQFSWPRKNSTEDSCKLVLEWLDGIEGERNEEWTGETGKTTTKEEPSEYGRQLHEAYPTVRRMDQQPHEVGPSMMRMGCQPYVADPQRRAK